MTQSELQDVTCTNLTDVRLGTITRGAMLALDLGTMTGWAMRSCGITTSGRLSLRPSRFDGGGMRFVRFRRWLEQLDLDAGPIATVHFEEVRRHLGTDAAHVYGGLLAVLTAWCEEHLVAYQGVPVGTIKRFITGKGNSRLEQAVFRDPRQPQIPARQHQQSPGFPGPRIARGPTPDQPDGVLGNANEINVGDGCDGSSPYRRYTRIRARL